MKAGKATSLFLILLFACTACRSHKPAPVSGEETASFNLSAITGSNQTQIFRAVTHASSLPKPVLEHFGKMADRGQPFNTIDVGDGNLPSTQLVAAAVSAQYCIVSYWQGGIVMRFETSIFELSGGKARLFWVSSRQGGLNFRDLKKMVESGRMRNDLEKKLSHNLTLISYAVQSSLLHS